MATNAEAGTATPLRVIAPTALLGATTLMKFDANPDAGVLTV
jgi:hypothetical protein